MRWCKLSCYDRVVIVRIENGEVSIYPGSICSTNGTSHQKADNMRRTVVFTDVPFNPHATSIAEAHEVFMRMTDVHLLSLDEAYELRNPHNARQWFLNHYDESMSTKIADALASTDFDATECPERLEEHIQRYLPIPR